MVVTAVGVIFHRPHGRAPDRLPLGVVEVLVGVHDRVAAAAKALDHERRGSRVPRGRAEVQDAAAAAIDHADAVARKRREVGHRARIGSRDGRNRGVSSRLAARGVGAALFDGLTSRPLGPPLQGGGERHRGIAGRNGEQLPVASGDPYRHRVATARRPTTQARCGDPCVGACCPAAVDAPHHSLGEGKRKTALQLRVSPSPSSPNVDVGEYILSR